MTAVAIVLCVAMILFAGLYAAAREHVGDLRAKLQDAYDQRDEAQEALGSAEADRQAADAKAEALAVRLRLLAESGDYTDDDSYLLHLEADLDPEVFGLVEILTANDVPDIAEEA